VHQPFSGKYIMGKSTHRDDEGGLEASTKAATIIDPANSMDTHPAMHSLADDVKRWGRELGFQQVGITDIDLGRHRERLDQWLANRYHG